MSEKLIEDFMSEVLSGEMQTNALSFAAHLRENHMTIEKFTFYGDDKLHWEVKCNDELVCFILLNDPDEAIGWTIMPHNSSTHRFANYEAEDEICEIARNNLNICIDGNCGGCAEGTGTRKRIFGKEIDNVCGMAFNFTNPDENTLKLATIMVDVRQSDILKAQPV